MDVGFTVALFACLILLLVIVVLSVARSRRLIHEWAKSNGFSLVSAEHRIFRTGPFGTWFYAGFLPCTVWLVTVEHEPGHQRKAWVRCGRAFLGLLSNHVEVQWVSPR